MDWLQIIGFVAPLILTVVVQGIKKIVSINSYLAMAVVFVIGGIGALWGIGPTPVANWIDTTVNAGWLIGMATFIYSLIKPRTV